MNTVITSKTDFPSYSPTGRWFDDSKETNSGNTSGKLSLERSGINSQSLLTEAARNEIQLGRIPDITIFCNELNRSLYNKQSNATAIEFIPVFKKLETWGSAVAATLADNPVRKHVLVENEVMKVVMIHWNPGDHSEIHSHPKGGCIFKVLHGSVLEERFSPDDGLRLLGTSTIHQGAMAYIDDNMAFHRVGNPNQTPAITIHAYTEGIAGHQLMN